MPANASLERDIAELLTRPVGRPSHKPVAWYKSFSYEVTTVHVQDSRKAEESRADHHGNDKCSGRARLETS